MVGMHACMHIVRWDEMACTVGMVSVGTPCLWEGNGYGEH